MISYLSSNGSFTINRLYIAGFRFFHDGNLTLLSQDNTHINVGYFYPFLEFDFHYLPHFYGPNTNSYTLDHCFDFAASGCLLNGFPTAAGVFVSFTYFGTERLKRVNIDFGFSHTHDLTIDLPEPLSPWYIRP